MKVGKKSFLMMFLAAVFFVSTIFAAIIFFERKDALAQEYYTKDIETLAKIDFSATGLVRDPKTGTYNQEGLKEFYEGNAIGTALDTTFTAAFMFDEGAVTNYSLSFRRSGWGEDQKINIYANGKVEIFKGRFTNQQEFNGDAFVAGTWYYLDYTVANIYSDAEMQNLAGYRSIVSITDKAEYNQTYTADITTAELESSDLEYNTGNFFLWIPPELGGKGHVASYEFDPNAEPEVPDVNPEECFTKDIASLPEIDFKKVGLVMDPLTDTFNKVGKQEFYEGNAPGTTVDTTFTAALMFEEGGKQGYEELAFFRSGWGEDLKLSIAVDGKIKLFKNQTPGDEQEFTGEALEYGKWYYFKYTVANLYSDESLTTQVGYRSTVTITDKADYNRTHTISFLNEEIGKNPNGDVINYNTGNFFLWIPTELAGKGYVASYEFDPEAEAVDYVAAVELDKAEKIEISNKLPMNADGIAVNSDSYLSSDGYYLNLSGIYEMNKTLRYRMQGSGSFHTAYSGDWIWNSYKADFNFNNNEVKFGINGDSTAKIVSASPALSAEKVYLVEVTVIEYFRSDNNEKAYEMFYFRVYEEDNETPVIDEAIQYPGPSKLPSDGSRGYFGIYMGKEGNSMTILPAEFSRNYAVTVVNGTSSVQKEFSYGKPYDISDLAVEKQGYTFKGWEYYRNGEKGMIPSSGTWTVDFTTQSADIYTGTLTAVYDPVEYEISYVVTGGSNSPDNPATINVEDGKIVLKNAVPTEAGYVFFGWYLDEAFTGEAITEIECNFESITLYAKIAEGCSITLVLPDGSEQVMPAEKGKEFTFPTTTSEGYGEITGWEKKDGDTWTPVDGAVVPDADATYRAVADPLQYKITYELDGGTNDGQNPSTYTIEDAITLGRAEKDGYFFVGWYNGDELVKGIALGSMGDIVLEARWAEDTLPETVQFPISENAVLLPVPAGLPVGAHYNVKLFDANNTELTVVSNSYAFEKGGEYKLVYEISLPAGTYTREVKVVAAKVTITVDGKYKSSYIVGDEIDVLSAKAGSADANVVITKDGKTVKAENGKLKLEKGEYKIVYSADGAEDVVFTFTVKEEGGTNWAIWGTVIGVGAAAVIAAAAVIIVKKKKSSSDKK